MNGLCECGCGLPAPLAKYSRKSKGIVAGQPLRFRLNHHRSKHISKYRTMQVDGGTKAVHRAIAERAVGRPLPRSVVVHHVDHDPDSRSPRLVICQNQGYHKLLHARERIARAGGNPNTQRICAGCRLLKDLGEFHKKRGHRGGGLAYFCKPCTAQRQRERYQRVRGIVACTFAPAAEGSAA